ncbi:MAG: hypothetical protein CL398_00115 [Acidiferrobacteraceae bacterium]|nr:hypothetical protein [Acidiferrobacteraceae bacterium]|tara:strand:- start:365 stop:1348 length:984 start_codon:yes stop_codon:yes gene_type:complete
MTKVVKSTDFKASVRPTVPLNFDFTESVEFIYEYPEVWIVYASDIYQRDNSDSVSEAYNADYELVYHDLEYGMKGTPYPFRDHHTMQVFATWEDAIEFIKRWKEVVMQRWVDREGPANVKHWGKYGRLIKGRKGCPYVLPEVIREAYIYDGMPLEDIFNPYQTYHTEHANTTMSGIPLDENGVNPETDKYIHMWERPITKEWIEDVTVKEQVDKWIERNWTYYDNYQARTGRQLIEDDNPHNLSWGSIRDFFAHPTVPKLTRSMHTGTPDIDNIPEDKAFVGKGIVYLAERDADGNLDYYEPTDVEPQRAIRMEWEVRVHKRPVRTL